MRKDGRISNDQIKAGYAEQAVLVDLGQNLALITHRKDGCQRRRSETPMPEVVGITTTLTDY